MLEKAYRFELKYEISPSQAGEIEFELRKFGMKPDINESSVDGGYVVTSLYFDSYNFSDYWDKAGGFKKRKKIRARIYEPFLNKSNIVWLEVKNKNESKNSKIRLKLNRDEWNLFLKRGPSALLLMDWRERSLKTKNDLLWYFANTPVKPKIFVRYLRRAFITDSGNLRITLDSNLETCKNDNLGYNGFMTFPNKESVVMEIKYVYIMPKWLGFIIKKFNLKRDAFSKYAVSLEALKRYNPLPR